MVEIIQKSGNEYLRTSRMVEETGEVFTFQAPTALDETEDLAQLSAKECMLYFLKLMHRNRNNPEVLADISAVYFQQAAEAIPIIEVLLGEIQVKQDEEQEFSFVGQLAQSIPFHTIQGNDGPQLDLFGGSESTGYSLVINSSTKKVGHSLFLKKTINDYEAFFRQVVEDCLQVQAVRKAAVFYLNTHKATEAKNNDNREQTSVDSENNLKDAVLKDQANHIKMSVHLTRQFVGSDYPPFRKDAVKQWYDQMGVVIDRPIERYGIDLTEIQFRVLESVLNALTRTNYKGNLDPPTPKEDLLQYFPKLNSVDDLPKMFKYIDSIPRLKFSKRELVRLAGMNDSNQGDTDHVMKALGYLALTPFCFYYSRAAYDKDRNLIRNKKTNEIEKEGVTAFDTLLKVKFINEEGTGDFKYLEIEPSGIFLDQQESFYMLIPARWRQEVEKQVGSGKSTKYLFLFLLYLRERYENKRRYNSNGGHKKKVKYEIKDSWLNIAKTIRMPETVYKGQSERAKKILTTCLETALKLDYLTKFDWTADRIEVVLNPAKFYNPTVQMDEPTEKDRLDKSESLST